jgi:hypothetical protein
LKPANRGTSLAPRRQPTKLTAEGHNQPNPLTNTKPITQIREAQ